MTSSELRKKYIDFFKSKGHVEIPSASVVPENDPSVLFTTAGMHPLVPYLLGETHPMGRRLVNYQRCIRTGDIDDVGDDTHCTFFTMLGNWSLQDYFKKESIEWSFEFLTASEWLNIPLSHLSFTVFEGDDDVDFDQESYDHWVRLGVSPDRIAKLGKEDNWWGPAGKTGPCGPDTEIFYWVGEGNPIGNKKTHPNEWMEIWNNVFMQFNKQDNGSLVLLEKGSVDTGMGLERTVVALQHKKTVYDTEIFIPIIETIKEVLGITDISREQEISIRIIADHLRTASILAMDGVVPTNKDQGYVMRRLIRRALRHLKKWNPNIKIGSAMPIILSSIEKTLSEAYPALSIKKENIVHIILDESERFEKTLDAGLKKLQALILQKHGEDAVRILPTTSASQMGINIISGKEAFNLFQTYGFPPELTKEVLHEMGNKLIGYGFTYDEQEFDLEMKKHQDLSRARSEQKFAGGLADDSKETTRLHTATHLLHQALRKVLGTHVEQKGSNINRERLRFDFSHDEKMTAEQIVEVERIVNEQIHRALPVSFELMTTEEAKQQGAIGLFEDKYAQIDGGKIKVYRMGDFSMEICGGPHVSNTSELGGFKIQKEEASSAGIRRIKAILG